MKTRTAAIAASATLIAALGIGYKVTQDRGYVPQTMSALVSSQSSIPLPRTLFANGFDGLPRCAVGNTLVQYTISGTPFMANALDWAALYGRTGSGQPIQPWPGAGTAQPLLINLTPGQCAVSKFTVAADANLKLTGFYEHGNMPFGPALDVSISEQPGDWSDSLGTGCYRVGWPADLSAGLNWRLDDLNPSQCHLKRGGTYWFNRKATNPQDPNCCVIYLKHSRTQPQS